MRRRAFGISLLITLTLGVAAVADSDEKKRAREPEPRATMNQIFDAMAELLPLGLDADRFASLEQREEITKRLRMLAAATGKLESHAGARDAGFEQLTRSLSQDVAEARFNFELERYEEARFFVVSSIRNCVACHSRLPSAREFPLANRLTDRVELSSLEPSERAQVLVVTRQFGLALDTWEAWFRDPEASPSQMDLTGALVDYLTVSIRVQRDLTRPRKALAKLAGRPDTPRYLVATLGYWITALAELADQMKAEPSVENARALVEHASSSMRWPSGRQGIIHDLVASSQLLRLVDASYTGPKTSTSTAELSEAYYLLGVIEARVADAFWVSQAEGHLVTSIQLAPGSPVATDAYVLLEEILLLGFGGASGGAIPEDVEVTLSELRQLIESR